MSHQCKEWANKQNDSRTSTEYQHAINMEIKHKKKKEQVEKIHNKAEYTNYDLWATIHFVM